MSRSKEWKLLVKMKKANTRIISIGINELKRIGIDPEKRLEGRWVVDSKTKRLSLEIKEVPDVYKDKGIRARGAIGDSGEAS